MTTITFLGGADTGGVDHVEWGAYRFDLRVPVECDDPHIVAKARKNRFFRVGSEVVADPPKPDPMAKARAAKAAKRMTADEAAKADEAGDA